MDTSDSIVVNLLGRGRDKPGTTLPLK